MATNTLWQRTQLGFLPPQSSSIVHHLSTDPFPKRLASLQIPAPQLSSQLQFNMGVPLSPENMATRFRKPKPIIIEKLEEPKEANKNRTFVARSMEGLSSSVLSNDRLAFAVDLARRDIKRAKLMPIPDVQVSNEEQVSKRHETPSKEKATKSKKAKRDENYQPKETMRHRVQNALRHQEKELQRGHELYFYPANQLNTGESPQAKEICKLRKELHKYMNQLENIQKDRPLVVRNKDKRMKTRQDSNTRLSDEDIDERQVTRAEEQVARSSRMLYTLKRQVQDLQDELNSKGRNIRHTKKSQTLHHLAAAHRAAVRALQTFISQSPLHPKGSHAPAHMYQDLAILIRQLSLLTTQLQIATDDKLDDLVLGKTLSQHDRHQQNELRKPNAFYKEAGDGSFSPQTLPSPPTKERKNPSVRVREGTNSPNPSPERDAILRAGLQALVRAREEALNTKQPDNTKGKVHFSSRPLPAKKSLLLPAQLKAKRQRAQQAVQRIKPPDMENANFAKDTVASNLRKVPPVQDKQETTDQPPKSLVPRTPTKSPLQTPRRGTPTKRFGTPERLCEQLQVSPPSHRRKLEDEFKSPGSLKYQRQMLQEERKMLEREIARQAWLDREAELRLQEIEGDLQRRRHHHPPIASDGVHLARQMIHETEEAILHRLRPLLDRAEAIMRENKKQEEKKKQSLQQQLTSLTSRTTMEQAHILADGILDDMLDDTVQELQRLEMDDEAEAVASGIQNSSTLENVMQRLQNFEKVENEIRRHWTQIKYDETDTRTRAKEHETDTKSQGGLPKDPAPIMFTRDRPERTDNYLESRIEQLRTKSRRRKDKARFGGQNDSRESDSTTSLLDGISSPRSSDVTSSKDPSRRLSPIKGLTRPTMALFVPSQLRASIASYRSKYERYLRNTATHVKGSFNPWKLVEQISDELLDDLMQDVVEELGNVCDEYTETIYKQEFVAAGGDKSITQ